jgi:hypothetical protein
VGTWGGSSAPAATSCGRFVQLVGSVIEKPHGLHCHTYRFWANVRLISCSKVIGLPQTGQITSAVGAAGSIIPYVSMRHRVPSMRRINTSARARD